MTESTNRLEEYYDADASRYMQAQWFRNDVTRALHQETRRNLLDLLAPCADQRLLEVGCGPGTWTREVAPLCRHITCIDISAKMIEQATRNVSSANVDFIQGNVLDADIARSGSYDGAYSVRVLEYFPSCRQFIAKVTPVIRAGGKLVLVTKSPGAIWSRRGRPYRIWVRVFGDDSATGLDAPTKEGYAAKFWQQMIPPQRLGRAMAEAGYQGINIRPLGVRLPICKGGLSELPLVDGDLRRRYLALTELITRRIGGAGLFLKTVGVYLSESYVISGIKVG